MLWIYVVVLLELIAFNIKSLISGILL